MNDYAIYRLTCSISDKSYIGLTKIGVAKRFKAHTYNALKGGSGALYAAIRKHGAGVFLVETLRTGLTREEACATEIDLIKTYGTRCPNGYNVTIGGDGAIGLECSDATRARMSDTHKRRQADPALRARTSAALLGKPKSEDHVRKVSQALAGKSPAAETRAKISASLIGRKQNAETVEKRVEKLRGRKMPPTACKALGDRTRGVPKSEEHRRKLSEALRGRRITEEQRARRSAALRGKPKSEEWKAKMRATLARKREAALAG